MAMVTASSAGRMGGYLVRPSDTGEKLPGVVVIHENRGLNPHIADVARRVFLAKGQYRIVRVT